MRWGLQFALLVAVWGLALPGSAMAFGPLSSFGGLGSGPGQLNAPKQVAIDGGGNLYVADSGNDRIEVFGGDGSFVRTITGDMDDPQDVAFGGGGRVFVADKGNDRIDVFGASGEPLPPFGEVGAGELEDPLGLTVSGSTVYVADSGHERIAAFSVGGAFRESESFPATLPQDAIVGAGGNLYVADGGEERVDVFTKAGLLVDEIGDAGPGALSGPVALAPDGSGGLYVADQLEERVVRFSAAGGFLDSFAAEHEVSGVAAGCGGNVFAVEEGAARVVRFGEPGTLPPPCSATVEEEPVAAPSLKPPSNRFHFAGVRKNRSNGFAVLFVRVPGAGKLSLTGRGFRRLSRVAHQATTVTIPIKPKVRLRHFLKQHGKGRIRVEVTFTPVGGVPRKQEKVVVLRRRRG